MMKKIIILLAVLACGVEQAGAVTRRFMAIKQVDWTTVYMYACYNDGTVRNITADWPGTQMTHWAYDGAICAEYIDLDIPSNVTNITVAFNNGYSDGSNQTWDLPNVDISSKDKLFYIWVDNNSDKRGTNAVDLDYYISGWQVGDSHSDNYRQLLNFNVEDGTYSCDLDFTSYSSTGNRCIYPFFASGEYEGHPWKNDVFCIRPNENNAQFAAFTNRNGTLNLSGDQCWTFTEKVKYKCIFNFPSNTWSVAPYFTREINTSVGYSTFSSDYAVAIPEGVTAYYASEANSSTKKVTMTKFKNGIAASTGALLYKSGGGLVKFTPATSTDSESNLLQATTGNNIYNSSKAQYILSKTKNNDDVSTIAFRKLNGSYSPAKGSAYLEVNSPLAPSFEIFFDDAAGGTTAIDAVKSAEPAVTDGAYYNLAGQRVTNPTKGLYIVNGRKVVVK